MTPERQKNIIAHLTAYNALAERWQRVLREVLPDFNPDETKSLAENATLVGMADNATLVYLIARMNGAPEDEAKDAGEHLLRAIGEAHRQSEAAAEPELRAEMIAKLEQLIALRKAVGGGVGLAKAQARLDRLKAGVPLDDVLKEP